MEGSGKKRKPLSDLTNTYNLIPTSTLRKLVSNPNSVAKPPISILKSNNPSPAANQKLLCADSSNNRSDTRSDTSIGSSSVGAAAARSSRNVQFQTLQRGGVESKDAPVTRRQSNEKSKKQRESAVAIVSPTPVEKRKEKGKTVDVPFSRSTPDKIIDSKNEFNTALKQPERKGRKDEANLNSSSADDRGKVFSEEVLKTYSRSFGRKDKGKAITSSSGCSMGKTEAIVKVSANYASCSFEKKKDGKKGILEPSDSSILRTIEIGKEFLDPSSFSDERRKGKGKTVDPFSPLHENTRKKGKEALHTPNIVEIAKHKGLSDNVAVNCLPPRRKRAKRKICDGASTCPPLTRTKNSVIDLDEAEDNKHSKSWTDAHPKPRKKRCSNDGSTCELPQDFVEQQRAYFKEVDEFELPVEEISQDELD